MIDWSLDFAIRRGFNPDQLIDRVINHIAGIGHKIKQAYNYVVHYEAYLINSDFKGSQENKPSCKSNAKLKTYSSAPPNKEEVKEISSKEISRELKIKHPILAEYKKLIQMRSNLSGYFAEKVDKQITVYAHELAKNKKLMLQLKAHLPILAKAITAINPYDKTHDLS